MFDKFSEHHIGVSNEKDLRAMLGVIGVNSVEELIGQVIPIPPDEIPPTSLLREFIGGSSFKY